MYYLKQEVDRENCPLCGSSESQIIYKGKRRTPRGRYYKKLRCSIIACGHEWVAESDGEFKQRIKVVK